MSSTLQCFDDFEQMDHALSHLHLPGLCCQLVGGTPHKTTPIATAWLCLQKAAYLLDAIEDNDTLKAPIKNIGKAQLLNLSTGYIFTAEHILGDLEHGYCLDKKTASAIRMTFNSMLLNMAGGQHLDLITSLPSIKECWQIAKYKSGKFFATVCFAGARVCTDDDLKFKNVSEFGNILGEVIQIVDEIDDIIDNRGGIDNATGKWGMPVAFLFESKSDAEKEELYPLLESAVTNKKAMQSVQQEVLDSGAIIYLMLEIEKRINDAEKMLEFSKNKEAVLQLMIMLKKISLAE